jgi:hypothetical protein
MSTFHKPAPRQDRRGLARSPIRDHAGVKSVHGKPNIDDPENGNPFGDAGSGSAPGANGPPTTGPAED